MDKTFGWTPESKDDAVRAPLLYSPGFLGPLADPWPSSATSTRAQVAKLERLFRSSAVDEDGKPVDPTAATASSAPTSSSNEPALKRYIAQFDQRALAETARCAPPRADFQHLIASRS